jgi:hypothetical protein
MNDNKAFSINMSEAELFRLYSDIQVTIGAAGMIDAEKFSSLCPTLYNLSVLAYARIVGKLPEAEQSENMPEPYIDDDPDHHAATRPEEETEL